MSEQPLDLRTFTRTVWRGRRLVGALAGLGLASGLAHGVVTPPLAQAHALVILPPGSMTTNSSGAVVIDTKTQVIIATSAPVLAAAGAALSPPVGLIVLKNHTVVSALSDQVLQIQVSWPHARDAVKLANAEASDYIAYVDKTASASSSGVLSGLEQDAAGLSKQVHSLQSQIDAATKRLAGEGATSPAGERDATLVGSLRTEQEDVSLQLNTVNSEIVSTELSGSVSAGATRVLQSASLVPTSKLDRGLFPAVGLFLGAFAGALVVLVRYRRDRRLRFRDEMASALGVPVLASLGCGPRQSTKDWTDILENYRPSSPVDSWNLRRLLYRVMSTIDAEKPPQLTVVAFADDPPALAAGVQLARFAADLGTRVTLMAGEHPSLALLRAACALLRPPGSGNEFFTMEAKSSGPELAAGRLTIALVAVDGVKPVIDASPGLSLLAVSSGFATAETLARLALVAADAGQLIDGIAVVNPDPGDGTVGIVPSAGEARQLHRYAARVPGSERLVGQPK